MNLSDAELKPEETSFLLSVIVENLTDVATDQAEVK